MEQRKFYQTDILSYLAEVVKQNTRAYTTDFDFDAKRLWDSAQETDMERRSFLWMCRPLGTWCVLEREVFLDDTNANCIWTHYADCPDGILAYRVVIEGIRDGKLAGKGRIHNATGGNIFETGSHPVYAEISTDISVIGMDFIFEVKTPFVPVVPEQSEKE